MAELIEKNFVMSPSPKYVHQNLLDLYNHRAGEVQSLDSGDRNPMTHPMVGLETKQASLIGRLKLLFCLLMMVMVYSGCYKQKPETYIYIFQGNRTDQNGSPISGVKVYVDTGRPGNFMGTIYSRYGSVFTDAYGRYLCKVVKDEYESSFQVCCKPPPGYTGSKTCYQMVFKFAPNTTLTETRDFQLVH